MHLSDIKQPISNSQINLRIISTIIIVEVINLVFSRVIFPNLNIYIELLLNTLLLTLIISPVIFFFIIDPFIISRKEIFTRIKNQQEKQEKNTQLKTKNLVDNIKQKDLLLDSLSDAIIHIDEHLNIVEYNKNSELLYGYAKEEILSQPMEKILPNKSTKNNNKFRTYIDSIKSSNIENKNKKFITINKEGKKIPVEMSITKLKIKDKIIFSLIIIDITSRVKREQDFNKSKEIAEKSLQDKSDFMAKMTHELRSPMHSIISFSSLGIKRISTAPKEKLLSYFQSIYDSANRLLSLINNLLDLSKLEENKMVLQYAAENLKSIIESCLKELHPQLAEKRIEYNINLKNIIPVAQCDKLKIHQVIINLISNSIKFSPDKGIININISSDHFSKSKKMNSITAIQLCVIDQGPGINSNETKTIFNNYVQSKNNNNQVEGTGLGLAICKEIIELHNGNIWAESNVTYRGGVVCFLIPITKDNV